MTESMSERVKEIKKALSDTSSLEIETLDKLLLIPKFLLSVIDAFTKDLEFTHENLTKKNTQCSGEIYKRQTLETKVKELENERDTLVNGFAEISEDTITADDVMKLLKDNGPRDCDIARIATLEAEIEEKAGKIADLKHDIGEYVDMTGKMQRENKELKESIIGQSKIIEGLKEDVLINDGAFEAFRVVEAELKLTNDLDEGAKKILLELEAENKELETHNKDMIEALETAEGIKKSDDNSFEIVNKRALSLEAKLKKAEDVLKFYSNRKNYSDTNFEDSIDGSSIDLDNGSKAEAILNQIRGEPSSE